MFMKKGALACAWTLMVISTVSTGESRTQKKGVDTSILTKQEIALLRAIIYDEGLCTHIRKDTPWPQREVSLRKDLVELHQRKRIATIKLLLEIVKGGRPIDSRAAAGMALALEEGPDYAVIIADMSLDSFDKVKSNDSPTCREKFVEQVEKSIGNAEKQFKEGDKK
jgi:hypothetical protein